MTRTLSTALLLLASACSRLIELPELGDTASVVLLVEGETPAVEVHDLAIANRRISVDGAEALTVLLYAESAAALGLSEGTLAPYSGEDGRRLPAPERALRRSLGGEWLDADAGSSALFESFRFAPDTPAQCAARGGCFPREGDRDCVAPCPAPAAPEEPMLPPSPLPVLTPCPAGWEERAGPLFTACEPRPGQTETPSCDTGTHPFLGGACRAVGAACASDGWPVPEIGRTVIWIRSGAAGVGTKLDPVGSIAAGIAAAPPDAVLAIASGRYVESVQLDGGRELLGACTGEAIVEGSIEVIDGSLYALTIAGDVRVSGQLTLDEVQIAGAASALEIGAGARLSATRAVVSGSARALSAEAGAQVRFTDSILAAPLAAELSAATATITGTLLFGETRAAGGRLHLERDELLRNGASALTSIESAQVNGEELVVRGPGEGSAIVSSPAFSTLVRSRIDAASSGLTLERNSSTTLEHVALSQVGGEGYGVSSTSGFLVARRVLVQDFINIAFVVENTNLLVTGSTMRRCARGVTAREGAEIHVDTSIIEETEDWAIRIDGLVNRPGETYQLEDLELRNIDGGVRIIRSQLGRLTRIATRDSRGPSLSIGEQATSPMVEITDLSISGAALECDPNGDDECAAIAIVEGMLSLDRFELTDIAGTGVRIKEGAGAELANGLIRRADVGIAAFGGDGRGALRAVVFEEVGAACEPCGGIR